MALLVLTMDVQNTVKKKFNYFSEGEFFTWVLSLVPYKHINLIKVFLLVSMVSGQK